MLLLKLFAGFYGVAKESFNFKIIQNYTAKNPPLKTIIDFLTIILTILLLSTYVLVIPFIILRCFVHIYLKIKHRENFGSFLSGVGTLFEVEDEKSTIVTTVTIEETNLEEFVEKLKIIVRKIHECNYMFSSVIKSCFGYKYYLKNQVKHREILRRVSLNSNKNITENDILKYLENHKITGEGKLWEVIVFEQPLVDKKIVFLIRINHCITDAYFMIALFKKYLLDPQISETKEFNLKKIKKKFSLDDLYLNTNPLNPKLDEFLFHGSEDQFITTFLENDVNYVKKIKKIKNLVGVGFTDVLLAGLVSGVADFMEKKIGKSSKDILIWLTTRGRSDDVVNILNGKFNSDELSNEFAILQFVSNTPNKNMSSVDFLKHTHTSCKNAKSSIDMLLAYLIPKLTCPYVPNFINKLSWKLIKRKVCLMATNMSAVDVGTVADRKINNVFAYTSLYTNQGMMLNTVTFNDKLQVCLVGRLKFLDNRKDLETIMKNIFVFIDNLEKEVDDCINANKIK